MLQHLVEVERREFVSNLMECSSASGQGKDRQVRGVELSLVAAWLVFPELDSVPNQIFLH